jgi:hypothetical protein
MNRSTEINLVQRIFDYLDTRSTTMMDSVHREPVTGYRAASKPGSSASSFSRTIRWSWRSRATSRVRETFSPTT